MNKTKQQKPIQLARKAGGFSYQAEYKSSTKPVPFQHVHYQRDSTGGNIDFTTGPKNQTSINKLHASIKGLKNFNHTEVVWDNPVDTNSEVELTAGLTTPDFGLMPSGRKVKITDATRAQHFAIADLLYKNSRSGNHTWHHLSNKYKMILVDMNVHRKHGHNGGIHLW